MKRADGKVVVVTGAASGVGCATAKRLAEEGARIVVADIDAARGRAVASELGDAALFFQHDVSFEASWVALIRATVERFGRLDSLVNNAAIFPAESIEQTSLVLWHRVMRVNADSCFLGCKYAIEAMKQDGGSIVNVASAAALAGFPGMAAYTASKGAVTALTRNVAAHCRNNGYRIRCNAVLPGAIVTPMTAAIRAGMQPEDVSFESNPKTGFCEPRDVANAIVYLVSDESRYVNGSELRVDNALLVALG